MGDGLGLSDEVGFGMWEGMRIVRKGCIAVEELCHGYWVQKRKE